MHASDSEPATGCTVWRFTAYQPPLDNAGISFSTDPFEVRQSDEFGRPASVADAQPEWGAGVVFGVVLAQPTAGLLGIDGRAGRVVVVVDRPGRQLGNRQHVDHLLKPRSSGAQSQPGGERNVRYRQSRTPLCKCAIGKSGEFL